MNDTDVKIAASIYKYYQEQVVKERSEYVYAMPVFKVVCKEQHMTLEGFETWLQNNWLNFIKRTIGYGMAVAGAGDLPPRQRTAFYKRKNHVSVDGMRVALISMRKVSRFAS